VKEYALYTYDIPIKTAIKRRVGTLLRLTTQNGQTGWGEIAPLPGWSQESHKEAHTQLVAYLEGKTSGPLYPSVSFGLIAAHKPTLKSVSRPVSGLLTGSYCQILQDAEKMIQDGFTVAKCKVSSLCFTEIVQLVEKLHPHLLLKLDANRAWDLKEALHLAKKLPLKSYDYFEEPLKDSRELSCFPYPTALDESLREKNPPDTPHCVAHIIKPTLQKPPKTLFRTVYSSSFETGIGLAHIAALSAEEEPVGLDTYRFLGEELLEEPLLFKGATLYTPPELRPNLSKLKRCEYGVDRSSLFHSNRYSCTP